jgi:Beta-lactamase enzyme family
MAQENTLESILQKNATLFQHLLKQPEKYRLQIIYTQINRDKNNRASFKTYEYRANQEEYFYPASTVKLAASVLALEKINDLKIPALNAESSFITLKSRNSQSEVKTDSSAKNGLPSISHYIKKILLVSDNEAYNRLFEFIGQKEMNGRMTELGFNDVRFIHRLQTSIPVSENKYSNPNQFVNSQGKIIYQEAEKINPTDLYHPSPILIGKGYLDGKGTKIDQALDFSQKNAFPLKSQHELLKRLLFPQSFPKKDRFRLQESDYAFLYKYMSQMPSESHEPNYAADSTYFPSYCKFLYYGSQKSANINPNIRIFNKVGDAYGFLLDNAYLVDFKNKVEFIVSAVILCNEDEIFNDDAYDYDRIGFPFFKNLGESIYQYELTRKKKFAPNLSTFEFNYED